MRKTLALGIIILFIGMCVHSVFAIETKTSPELSKDIYQNEELSNNFINLDNQETFGFYQGLIIGRISMLQGSGDRVKFWASSIVIISGILFPQRQYLNQRWVELAKPYLGIIKPTFIFVFGTCFSGW
jgi:hypothetical protein